MEEEYRLLTEKYELLKGQNELLRLQNELWKVKCKQWEVQDELWEAERGRLTKKIGELGERYDNARLKYLRLKDSYDGLKIYSQECHEELRKIKENGAETPGNE